MYRFVLSPRWIAGHVLAVVLVTGFVAAGFWQLSRHEWRADINRAVTERSALGPISSAELIDREPDEIEYRNVLVSGEWTDDLIAIRSRSLDGQSGCHIVSLVRPDGENFLVVVNRGWVQLTTCEQDDRSALAPPADEVELFGRIRVTEPRVRFAADEPADGVLDTMSRVNVPRIDQQAEGLVAPVFVQVIDSVPAESAVRLLPAPATDAGPHLGYAFQWFAFAVVGLVGYPLVLRWQARVKAADD